MPEVPTPINTVTNIEHRLAANTVKAMAISSCGLSDTKQCAMKEINTQPGAASITTCARRLNVRLRNAKKPINRVE